MTGAERQKRYRDRLKAERLALAGRVAPSEMIASRVTPSVTSRVTSRAAPKPAAPARGPMPDFPLPQDIRDQARGTGRDFAAVAAAGWPVATPAPRTTTAAPITAPTAAPAPSGLLLSPQAAVELSRLLQVTFARDSAAARADFAPPLKFFGLPIDGRGDLTWVDLLALAPQLLDLLGIGDVIRRFVADGEAHSRIDQAA